MLLATRVVPWDWQATLIDDRSPFGTTDRTDIEMVLLALRG